MDINIIDKKRFWCKVKATNFDINNLSSILEATIYDKIHLTSKVDISRFNLKTF